MSKGTNSFVMSLAVVGSLIFVNIIGWTAFARLDLTSDQRFTLSPSTTAMLDRLDDRVTIRAYFSEKMSPRYSNNRRYVRDILDEYYAASGGRVVYEFIDPVAQETDEDKKKKEDLKRDIFGRIVREKTSVETELEGLGVQPIQDRVIKGDSFEDRKVYMGIVLKSGDEQEVIPVVSDPATLEYELTTRVRKLTRTKTPKVRILSGFGGPTEQEGLRYLFALLGENYDVESLDLAADASIPDDVNAIVLVGPTQALSEKAKREVDRFISMGGSAALFLDDNEFDLRTLQPTPTDHGMKPQLASYGVNFSEEYVWDPECQVISMNTGSSFGGIPVSQQIQYPLIPSPQQLNPDNPITRGLGQTAFPFTKSVKVESRDGLEIGVLASSSPEARLLKTLDTNPLSIAPSRMTAERVTEPEVRNFLVTMKGAMKSHFASEGGQEGSEETPAAVGAARLLVSGTSRFIRDELMRNPMHQALALNAMDWLLLDEALLGLRTRGLTSAPFDSELTDTARNSIRYANMLGLPLLFIVFGLIRRQLRESKRNSVKF